MGVVQLICPRCGENVELDDVRKYGFCHNCGKRIYLKSIKQDKNRSITDNTPTKKRNKKLLLGILSVFLIPIIVLLVLLVQYFYVIPTSTVDDADGSYGTFQNLPISYTNAVFVYKIDENSVDNSSLIPNESVTLIGKIHGAQLYLIIHNSADYEKPIEKCDSICSYYIDESCGENIALGARGMFDSDNPGNCYRAGIHIGQSANSVLKNTGEPDYYITDEEGTTHTYVYRINCYNQIVVELTNDVVTKVQYLKSRHIFDFIDNH